MTNLMTMITDKLKKANEILRKVLGSFIKFGTEKKITYEKNIIMSMRIYRN